MWSVAGATSTPHHGLILAFLQGLVKQKIVQY